MIDKRILVVDDAPAIAKIIADKLRSEDYEVTTAQNGEEALDLYKDNPFPLVIADIEMPVMGGNELIDHLNQFSNPPLIFIITSHKEPNVIIDIMKKGVYDYMVKPFDIEGLPLKVKRAFEVIDMKRNIAVIEKEKMVRLEQQLDWYRWMERARTKDDIDIHNLDKSFLHRLQTIFNQGSGFGNLIAIIDLLTYSAKEDGNYYLIKKDLIDMLKSDKEKTRRALEIIQEIDEITHNDVELDKIAIGDFHELIKQGIADSGRLSGLRNQRIILNDVQLSHREEYLDVNKKYISGAFSELLLNACKFSVPHSNILVIFKLLDNNVHLSIMNTPVSVNKITGIPMEYENIIFEPLFRLSKIVHENYDTLDYGLGLTKVESIIKKHNGKISVSNIEDHTDLVKGSKTRVNFTITLPLRG
ncbi:MAG: response regulator [Spirochaetes bacterium]|jgi:CheY-like chemotaxis protein|nr:response regulator [Spirochaetota bacterium]